MFVKEKIKINFIQGSYWLVPSIFTLSKRKWVSHPYKNIESMIEKNNWSFTPLAINMNRDSDLGHYNKFQKVRELEQFMLDDKITQIIQEKGSYDFVYSNNIIVRLDKKSLKFIFAGSCFSYPKFYFDMVSKEATKKNEKIILLWRKTDFYETKESISINPSLDK